MKLRIEVAAQNDLIEGYLFYEKSIGQVGDYFLASLFSDIESLKIFGGIHRKEFKSLYRSLSRRFPFAIYYTLEKEEIVIRAVLDCRRDPSWVRKRIEDAKPHGTSET